MRPLHMAFDEGVEEMYILRTTTGGRYVLVRTSRDKYWLSVNNEPNPYSIQLDPEDWWEVQQPRSPWPPIVGTNLFVLSKFQKEPLDHPDRMPGGGKNTSMVIAVIEGTPNDLIAMEA